MADPFGVGHRLQVEACTDEPRSAQERMDATMAQHDMDSRELQDAARQDGNYFTVPVTFIDLYWVKENEKLADGDEPSQTEFVGELFFNDSVYEYVCEADGKKITSGYVDDESGVSYCLEHLGEMINRGDARLEKRESK